MQPFDKKHRRQFNSANAPPQLFDCPMRRESARIHYPKTRSLPYLWFPYTIVDPKAD
jgi:hypothetical protein